MLIIADDASPTIRAASPLGGLRVDVELSSQWLDNGVLQRCIGLPVVTGDPSNVIGAVFGAYAEDETARVILRIFDRDTIALVKDQLQGYTFVATLIYLPADGGEAVTDSGGGSVFAEPPPKLFISVMLHIHKDENYG
jgi:hypothetical protein